MNQIVMDRNRAILDAYLERAASPTRLGDAIETTTEGRGGRTGFDASGLGAIAERLKPVGIRHRVPPGLQLPARDRRRQTRDGGIAAYESIGGQMLDLVDLRDSSSDTGAPFAAVVSVPITQGVPGTATLTQFDLQSQFSLAGVGTSECVALIGMDCEAIISNNGAGDADEYRRLALYGGPISFKFNGRNLTPTSGTAEQFAPTIGGSGAYHHQPVTLFGDSSVDGVYVEMSSLAGQTVALTVQTGPSWSAVAPTTPADGVLSVRVWAIKLR